MTVRAAMKPFTYIFAVLLASAVLFWASEMLFVVSFGWPTNSLLRNLLNLVAYCGLPVVVAGLLIANSLRALGRGQLWVALALVLVPVLVIGLSFIGLYWQLS